MDMLATHRDKGRFHSRPLGSGHDEGVVLNAILVVDLKGRIVQTNEQAETLFGYTRDELLERLAGNLLHERSGQTHVERREDLFAALRSRPMEAEPALWAVRKDGSELPVEIGLVQLQTTGEMLYIASIRDLSNRMRIEQDLLQTRERLAELVKKRTAQLSEFIGTASHKLHTVSSITKGGLDDLLDGCYGPIEESKREILADIKQSTSYMEKLTDQLLELSRIDSGTLELNPQLIDLRKPIEAVIAQPKYLQGACHIKVVTNMPDSPVEVHVDEALIFQVLTNLLENAVDFAGAEVSVRLVSSHEKVELLIEDDGPGIPKDSLNEIFKRFVHLQNGLGRQGTGLGLSIVDEIVQAHGGTVRAENRSRIGKSGACFVVTLPTNYYEVQTSHQQVLTSPMKAALEASIQELMSR